MKLEDELKQEVDRLRAAGVVGDLFVVPVTHKRCFVACPLGECNCVSSISDGFCVTNEFGKKHAIADANRTLKFLNDKLHEIQLKS